MEKGLSQEVITRIERIEKMDISDAVELRYFTEKLSYRKLIEIWKINNRTVAKVIRHCNKEPRQGSEAVKTQWINNINRRKQASEVLRKTNHDLALRGEHVRQGKNKSNSELIRSIAEKLRKSSSFFNPDVKRKAQINSLKSRKEKPENNGFLKTEPTKRETIIRDFLISKGVNFDFRYIVSGFIFNFYLPDFNLLIDLQSQSRFPLPVERHKEALNKGYGITYCVHEFTDKANFSNLYNYITSLNKFSFNPASISHESVIWGARKKFPFGKDCNEFSVEFINDNITNKTHIATTSND
jgi:hypothetical protein